MSPFIEKKPTQFFAVIGAAYVPERHLDSYSHYAEHATSRQSRSLRADANDVTTEQIDAATVELRERLFLRLSVVYSDAFESVEQALEYY
jgi:hypothetical protein